MRVKRLLMIHVSRIKLELHTEELKKNLSAACQRTVKSLHFRRNKCRCFTLVFLPVGANEGAGFPDVRMGHPRMRASGVVVVAKTTAQARGNCCDIASLTMSARVNNTHGPILTS